MATVPSCSDELFKNMCLLNSDLLTFKEFCAACSAGDFGRVEDMLGTITIMFCGGGSINYTHELCWLIQNLRKSWTPEFV
ncbi:hypothetical protein K439DRAFT_1344489 [Ramaria rubella]|nr:hypothetical protein K439DRAFT_1344489 [Ramaria rubella]